MRVHVVGCSFEPRCTAYFKQYVKAGCMEPLVLVDFYGYESVGAYQDNLAEFQKGLSRMKVLSRRIACWEAKPLSGVRLVEQVIREIAGGSLDVVDLVVDISVLPHPYLLLMSSLCDRLRSAQLVYSRAVSFGQRLSRGVVSCTAVPMHEGRLEPSRPVVLVLLLGFEGYKAEHAWEMYSPHRTVAILGTPPGEPNWREEAKRRNRFVLRQEQVTEYTTNSLDVESTVDMIDRVYDEAAVECNCVVVPLGTKLETVAAHVISKKHPDIQVAYVASSTYYAKSFSRGCGPVITIDYTSESRKWLKKPCVCALVHPTL